MMEHVSKLIQKLNILAARNPLDRLDVDLMLDYTRKLYDALLDTTSQQIYPVTADVQPTVVPRERTEKPLQPSLENEISTHQNVATPQLQDASIKEVIFDKETIIEKDEDLSDNFALQPEPIIDPIAEQKALATDNTLPDVRNKIGINDKYQFISMLFSNHAAAYEIALSHLNNLPHYDAAAEYMSEELAWNHGWQEEDDTVENFKDLLKRFYATR